MCGMLATLAARLRSVPPIGQDVLVVVVLAVIQVAFLGPVAHRPAFAVALALEPVPLLLRRSQPALAMALVGAADVALVLFGAPLETVGASIVVAAYSAGAHQTRTASLGTMGLGALSVVGIVIVTGTRTGNADRISVLVVLGVAWWIGASLRERRAYSVELERQADELRAARTELAEQAVVAERLRLARELHDVVAHSLAIVALHSSVGAHNAAQRPQDAADALAAVNAASRTAMTELRALLHVLREGAEPDTAPLPTLADLANLSRSAPGVQFTVDGPVADVPQAVSLTAYRIAQEALTNVVKHADPTTARAHVSVEAGLVRVTVTNALSTIDHVPAQSGAGLAGMRERVAAFGGTLTVGPTPAGWTVDACLPLDGAEA